MILDFYRTAELRKEHQTKTEGWGEKRARCGPVQTSKTKKIRGKHSMVLSTKITDRRLPPVVKLKLGLSTKGLVIVIFIFIYI